MTPILTAAETRAAEEALIAAGISVETLMERAGAGVAEAAWRLGDGGPALILCGPGNNGGDGYVAARLLAACGMTVRVAAKGEPRTEAARAARGRWVGGVEALVDAKPAPLLIDCLFGTGLTRGLEAQTQDALLRLTSAASRRIAVDLPSGVATDDGVLLGDVPTFDLTVALGALKPAHLLQPAAGRCSRIALVDIGLTAASAVIRIERPRLRGPGPADHKYTRGYVAVVAGPMAGAARLAAEAAQRSGAGYVALVGEGGGGPAALVHRTGLDALEDPRIGAIVIGPGLGRDLAAADKLAAALASGRPLVLDADALHLLGRRLPLIVPAVLTPHEGEFARLFGQVSDGKLDRARVAATRAGSVVLLKGADTVIAAPDGRAAIAPPAPAWLASAGTGDVLAGVIAAMVASGLPPFEAACAGAWLQAQAARLAGPAMIADDMLTRLPVARAQCR